MDLVDMNEQLAQLQEGRSDDDRFAALCLTELLREISQLERAGGTLMWWEWEARVADVAAVCGLADAAEGLWEWCRDISADMLCEPADPWAPDPAG
jgi:formylglycine-generating enzyme required for sulfatase activity